MILNGEYGQTTIFTETAEYACINQIKTFLNSVLAQDSKIAVMEDCHAGKGCTIGFTMTVRDKICPNLVGVDIGCSMLAVKLPIKISTEQFLNACEHIPTGFKTHTKQQIDFNIDDLTFKLKADTKDHILKSLGTLGSGNHFIELNEDENGDQYLVIHTGSRNLGVQVCAHHMEIAKTQNPLGDLSYLTEGAYDDYLHDMQICQKFSTLNRNSIAEIILRSFNTNMLKDTEHFETMHNYIDFNDNILRKGAISAVKDKKVLIPFNMRDGSIIGVGLGNQARNYSAPHGAGRIMSRSQAKKNISLDEFQKTMQGIASNTVNLNTIDEAPMAYKPFEDILNGISDTVKVTHRLKVLANFKGF